MREEFVASSFTQFESSKIIQYFLCVLESHCAKIEGVGRL